MGADRGWWAVGPGSGLDRDWQRLAESPCPRTAMRVEGGVIRHREAHVERLSAAASFLGFKVPWLQEAFDATPLDQPDGILRLRVLVTFQVLLSRLEEVKPLPNPYLLAPRAHPLGDVRNVPGSSHKGLMGSWSEVALASARREGADDLLCLWPEGTVAETTIASVAVLGRGFLRVPPASGRVGSLAEAMDLPKWAFERGLRLESGPVHLAEVVAGNLLCFNAARGVWQAEILLPRLP